MSPPLVIELVGLRTQTGLNAREHHMARKRRVSAERQRVMTELFMKFPDRSMPGFPDIGHIRKLAGPAPYVVTLTRKSPRLADDDNVVGGLKAVRDQVGEVIGTGDGPKAPVSWRYGQEQADWGVRIEIEGSLSAHP